MQIRFYEFIPTLNFRPKSTYYQTIILNLETLNHNPYKQSLRFHGPESFASKCRFAFTSLFSTWIPGVRVRILKLLKLRNTLFSYIMEPFLTISNSIGQSLSLQNADSFFIIDRRWNFRVFIFKHSHFENYRNAIRYIPKHCRNRTVQYYIRGII